MNVRASLWMDPVIVVTIALGVVVLGCSLAARAFDFDPLLATPEVAVTGVALPGDAAPVTCPALKDFATPLALGEAVDLALCNNPQIQSDWANIKIQAAALG